MIKNMNNLQNVKMWCHNNLGQIGKWCNRAVFLFRIVVVAFIFVPFVSVASQPRILDSLGVEIKDFGLSPGKNIGTEAPSRSNLIKRSSAKNIDFSKFFSSSTISSNDITSFLKEAVVISIELTILIISITAQVLKGLLSAFKQ